MMDGLLDFLQTPGGMGLLSAAAAYAAGARRGTPINNIGTGLLGGIQGYAQALDKYPQRQWLAGLEKLGQTPQTGVQQLNATVGNAAPTPQNAATLSGIQQQPAKLGGINSIPLDYLMKGVVAGVPQAKTILDLREKMAKGIERDPNKRVVNAFDGSVISDIDYDAVGRLEGAKEGAKQQQAATYAEQIAKAKGMGEAATRLPSPTAYTQGGRPLVGVSEKDILMGNIGQTQQPNTPTQPNLPIGLRNNNPGNLRPVGQSTGFQKFGSPEEGLAAIDRNLQSYGKKGFNTIESIITRWAPPSENNTQAYISSVSKRFGIDPKQPLDMSNPIVRHALATGIVLHENGTGKVFSSKSPAPAAQLDSEADRAAWKAEVEVQKTAAQERSKRIEQAQWDAPKAISKAERTLATVDNVLKHPGLSRATGLRGVIDPTNYIRGTDAYDFGVALKHIEGQAFLEAFETLKGGGQITEIEGRKATEAIARINRGQSEAEMIRGLKEYRDVVSGALARIKKQSASGGASTNPEIEELVKKYGG